MITHHHQGKRLKQLTGKRRLNIPPQIDKKNHLALFEKETVHQTNN